MTASTVGPSASIVTRSSASATASAGVAAASAPRPSARSSVRFHARTSCPASASRRAIGAPMIPVPRTATRMPGRYPTSNLGRRRSSPSLRRLRLTARLRWRRETSARGAFPGAFRDGRRQRDARLVLGRRDEPAGGKRDRERAPHARGGGRDRRRRRRVDPARLGGRVARRGASARRCRCSKPWPASCRSRSTRPRPRWRAGRWRAGAELVNDVTALRSDPELAGVVGRGGLLPLPDAHARRAADDAGRSALRRRGRPRSRPSSRNGSRSRSRRACAEEMVCLDPGIGFGKTMEQNFELVRRLDVLLALGRPVVIGFSRKRSLGRARRRPGHDHGPALRQPRRRRHRLRARRDDPPRPRRPRDGRGARRRQGGVRVTTIELAGIELLRLPRRQSRGAARRAAVRLRRLARGPGRNGRLGPASRTRSTTARWRRSSARSRTAAHSSSSRRWRRHSPTSSRPRFPSTSRASASASRRFGSIRRSSTRP